MSDQQKEQTIAVPVSTWSRLDAIAAQIETPTAAYDPDNLKMAQKVIADCRERAAMIRRLVPHPARNSF